jgi:hypothetical protein
MYNCGYYSVPSDSDSISVDSLDMDAIDSYIELDENGYPAVVEDDEQPDQATPTPVENSNAEATKEE